MLIITIPHTHNFRFRFLNAFHLLHKQPKRQTKANTKGRNPRKYSWLDSSLESERRRLPVFITAYLVRWTIPLFPAKCTFWYKFGAIFFKKMPFLCNNAQIMHFGAIWAALEILWATEKYKIPKHKKVSAHHNFNVIRSLFIIDFQLIQKRSKWTKTLKRGLK